MTKAEKQGRESSAFKEARQVIQLNYGVTDDHEKMEIYADISH